MTVTEAKKRFRGFTRWHNSLVKPEYKCRKAKLWEFYGTELMNTGILEIPSRESKDGHPYLWS